MSTIGRKPLVVRLLGGLSTDELKALASRIDNALFKEYDDALALYNSDYIGNVYIPKYNGVLIGHTLLAFSEDSQFLVPFAINAKGEMARIRETVTITELRSELDDRLLEVGAIVKGLVFENVEVAAADWESDVTYADFPYKAEIECEGVTEDMVMEVIFAVEQATSGNYAPINISGDGTVTIYGKVNTAITIPTIKEVL